MSRRTLRWLAVPVMVASVTIAGCSSSPEDSEAPDSPAADSSVSPGGTAADSQPASVEAVIQQAMDSTTAAGSARFRSKVEMKGTTALNSTISGVYDFAQDSMEASMKLGSGGMDLAVQVIRIGDDSYVKAIASGGKWLRESAGEFSGALGANGASTALAALADSTDVREDGKQNVDGVPTTRYVGEFDVVEALNALLTDLPEELGEAASDGTVTIWVDSQDRVRRYETVVDLKFASNEHRLVTRTDFTDFGVDTDISAPDPDDVTDSADLMQGLTGQ